MSKGIEIIEVFGEATEAQISQWKAVHGEVFEVTVENHFGYLKKPDRKVLSYATTVGQTDPMKFNELILQNCWLGGSEELKTKDEYFFAVVAQMNVLIEIKEAQIKKL